MKKVKNILFAAGILSLMTGFWPLSPQEAQAQEYLGNFFFAECTYVNAQGVEKSGGKCQDYGGTCGVSSSCG